MRATKIIGFGLFVALLFLLPGKASACAGVGVGTGKVIVPGILTPTATYSLAPMAVFNTGDEPSGYAMEVTFNQTQPQHKPDAAWVSFSPARFTLAPGQAQVVNMELHLPAQLAPGDYYAYLEAHAVHDTADGLTGIMAAAAAKFYFTSSGSPQPEPPTPIVQNTQPAPVAPATNDQSASATILRQYFAVCTQASLWRTVYDRNSLYF